jgi:hypothetical protein
MGMACSTYGGKRGVYWVLVGKSGRPRCRWDAKLRWIFRKGGVGVWIGSSWLRIGQVAGTCERGNDPSDSIKCREFLD